MTFALATPGIQTLSFNLERTLCFGDAAFADYVFEKVPDSPSSRFKVAQLVLETMRNELFEKLFSSDYFFQPPVFNLIEGGAYPGTRKANLYLVMLPNFRQPLRTFLFKAYAGERLRLWEVCFHYEPDFGPIDSHVFLEYFKILNEDNLAFREAILEILEERNASFDGLVLNKKDDFRGALKQHQRIKRMGSAS